MNNASHKCVGVTLSLLIINLSQLNCSNDEEGKVLLRKLGRINKPLEISFKGTGDNRHCYEIFYF